jgi:disulfide bond formation protein DsbB
MNVRTMEMFFGLLTVVVIALVSVVTILAVGARVSEGLARARDSVWGSLGGSALWLAWAIAFTATLGSLYFSEVANFTPCLLCWYQRIAMYPLAVLLLVAAIRRDRTVWTYALPIAAIGATISAIHYLLEWGVIPSGSLSCDPDNPCTVIWFRVFGFATMAFMALSAFLAVIWLTWIARQTDDRV